MLFIPWVQAGKRPNGEPYDALLWALEEAAKKAGAMVTVREVHRLSETNAPPKRQVDREISEARQTQRLADRTRCTPGGASRASRPVAGAATPGPLPWTPPGQDRTLMGEPDSAEPVASCPVVVELGDVGGEGRIRADNQCFARSR